MKKRGSSKPGFVRQELVRYGIVLVGGIIIGSSMTGVGFLYKDGVIGHRPVASPSPAAPDSAHDPYHLKLTKDNVLIKINEERLKAGLPQYFYTTELQSFADSRLTTITAGGCSHDDKSLDSVLAQAKLRFVGEDIACGYDNSTNMVIAWMGSPTHKDLILSKNFTSVTIAVGNGNGVLIFSSK